MNIKKNLEKIDFEEFYKSVTNQRKQKQIKRIVGKLKKSMKQDQEPLYYNGLLNHVNFVSKRQDLKMKINDFSLDKKARFGLIKEMMKLEYENKEQKKGDISKKKQKLLNGRQIKSQDASSSKDVIQFLDQMKQQISTAQHQYSIFQKHKTDLQLDECGTKILKKQHTSLPKINHKSEHSCWNRSLNQIDQEVKEKLNLYDINQKKQCHSIQHSSSYRIKELYNFDFDQVNEIKPNQIDGKNTGNRSLFEESLLSIIPSQAIVPTKALQGVNDSNISSVKKRYNKVDDSGEHVPKSILRKLQIFKNNTKDNSSILDKSLLSNYTKQSRISPIQRYQVTNTDSQNSNNDSYFLVNKKRTLSQQEFKNTPHFKQSYFHLPSII